MLQISQLKENKERIIRGLEKKKFKEATQIIDHILSLDQSRKDTQSQLDNILAEANNIAKDFIQD